MADPDEPRDWEDLRSDAIRAVGEALNLRFTDAERAVDSILAVVDEEAVNRMAAQFVDESRMRALEIREGKITLGAIPAREITAQWIGAARTMIGDAPNYIEMDVTMADTGEGYTFYLMRRGKLTPHQAREQAEAQVEALRKHLGADHAVMVKLGLAARALAELVGTAIAILEQIKMDTGEDRALHARAIARLRAALGKARAAMAEAGADVSAGPAHSDGHD